jgi:hypothetical protein
VALFLIAFRRVDPSSLTDRLIASFDGHSPFCHTEVLWPDRSKVFRIHAWYGCQYYDNPTYDESQWVFVPIELDAKAVSAACDVMAGDRYDEWGCLKFVLRSFCWFCPPLINWLSGPSRGRWYCSEGTAKIISVSGGPDLRQIYIMGPGECYRQLVKSHFQ